MIVLISLAIGRRFILPVSRDQFSPEIWNSNRFVRMRPSAGTVATHKHPIQAAMLAVIVIEAGFMQRGAVIDDQQVALLIFMRIAKLWLRDLIGQILQKLLRFFG